MTLNKARLAPYSKYIPIVFGVIIALFVAKLWYDNYNLMARNEILRTAFLRVDARNGELSASLTPITQRLDRISGTIESETHRRATAEEKADALQKQVDFLTDSKQCSISIDPNAVQKGSNDPSSVIIQAAPAGGQ